MNHKSSILCGLIIAAVSLNAQAAKGKNDGDDVLVIQPDKVFVKDEALQNSSKGFDYDWMDTTTIATNKSKAAEIEAVLKKPRDNTKLTVADQQMLGKMLYQLGTYYLHVEYNADKGIEKMNLASSVLKSKEDQAWIYDNLAYAHEQKYAATHKDIYKEQALTFTDIVISDLYRYRFNKQVAFAYTIKSMVQYDAKEYADAEKTMKQSLQVYESIPDGKKDQYMRAKNRMAAIMLNQKGKDKQALAILNDVKKYWQLKGNIITNPYAASNYMTLGYAYYKAGQMQDARDAINSAISIYSKLYGANSPILAEPYRRLAEVYKQIGDKKQMDAWLKKADGIKKT